MLEAIGQTVYMSPIRKSRETGRPWTLMLWIVDDQISFPVCRLNLVGCSIKVPITAMLNFKVLRRNRRQGSSLRGLTNASIRLSG